MQPEESRPEESLPSALPERGRHRVPFGLLSGILLLILILALPRPDGMPEAAWRVLAVGALMVAWWVGETLPVGVTGLVPLVAFPLLGVASIEATAVSYADPVIFLVLGGLVLGLAVQRWSLHRRLALGIIRLAGTRPANLVLGFMAATTFLGLWGIGNTANAAMMLPVTLSVAAVLVGSPERMARAGRDEANLVRCLVLGVAFAASFGGLVTVIGTPPNALFAAHMQRTYGREIGFAQWMIVGAPLAIAMLLGTWLILTRLVFPVSASPSAGLADSLRRLNDGLGPMTGPERRVGLVFLLTALAWLGRPFLAELLPGLGNSVIAIAAVLVLFLVPSGRGGALMDWDTAVRLPWGVLLLFGGGLALGTAMSDSGLAGYLGALFVELGARPGIAVLVVLALATVVLSEVASNTATAAAFLPLTGAVAIEMGLDPIALTLPMTLAASCGFMLPIATPPNALFYASGYVTMAQMVRAGALVDLLGIGLVILAIHSVARLAFGLP